MSTEIEDIKKMSLGEGDIVVCTVDFKLTMEVKEQITKSLKSVIKDNVVMVLDSGMTIDVVAKKDAEGM